MPTEDISMKNLTEVYFEMYGDQELNENVSGGRGRRASSQQAPIPQRVTAAQAAEIRRNARQKNDPIPEEPKKKKKEPPEPTTVPSRGVGAEEPALRRRTPEGHRKRGASPMSVAKKKQRLLSTGQDTTQKYRYARTPTPESKARAKKISAALRNRENWGSKKESLTFQDFMTIVEAKVDWKDRDKENVQDRINVLRDRNRRLQSDHPEVPSGKYQTDFRRKRHEESRGKKK